MKSRDSSSALYADQGESYWGVESGGDRCGWGGVGGDYAAEMQRLADCGWDRGGGRVWGEGGCHALGDYAAGARRKGERWGERLDDLPRLASLRFLVY